MNPGGLSIQDIHVISESSCSVWIDCVDSICRRARSPVEYPQASSLPSGLQLEKYNGKTQRETPPKKNPTKFELLFNLYRFLLIASFKNNCKNSSWIQTHFSKSLLWLIRVYKLERYLSAVQAASSWDGADQTLCHCKRYRLTSPLSVAKIGLHQYCMFPDF